MKKALFLMLAFVGLAFGAEEASKAMVLSYSALASGLVLGIAALGGAVGMGNAAAAAISGMARNPGLSSSLTKNMFIALAIIEAQVLYGLVIVFILLYSNPLLGLL